jgi:hypothetical protein
VNAYERGQFCRLANTTGCRWPLCCRAAGECQAPVQVGEVAGIPVVVDPAVPPGVAYVTEDPETLLATLRRPTSAPRRWGAMTYDGAWEKRERERELAEERDRAAWVGRCAERIRALLAQLHREGRVILPGDGWVLPRQRDAYDLQLGYADWHSLSVPMVAGGWDDAIVEYERRRGHFADYRFRFTD